MRYGRIIRIPITSAEAPGVGYTLFKNPADGIWYTIFEDGTIEPFLPGVGGPFTSVSLDYTDWQPNATPEGSIVLIPEAIIPENQSILEIYPFYGDGWEAGVTSLVTNFTIESDNGLPRNSNGVGIAQNDPTFDTIPPRGLMSHISINKTGANDIELTLEIAGGKGMTLDDMTQGSIDLKYRFIPFSV